MPRLVNNKKKTTFKEWLKKCSFNSTKEKVQRAYSIEQDMRVKGKGILYAAFYYTFLEHFLVKPDLQILVSDYGWKSPWMDFQDEDIQKLRELVKNSTQDVVPEYNTIKTIILQNDYKNYLFTSQELENFSKFLNSLAIPIPEELRKKLSLSPAPNKDLRTVYTLNGANKISITEGIAYFLGRHPVKGFTMLSPFRGILNIAKLGMFIPAVVAIGSRELARNIRNIAERYYGLRSYALLGVSNFVKGVGYLSDLIYFAGCALLSPIQSYKKCYGINPLFGYLSALGTIATIVIVSPVLPLGIGYIAAGIGSVFNISGAAQATASFFSTIGTGLGEAIILQPFASFSQNILAYIGVNVSTTSAFAGFAVGTLVSVGMAVATPVRQWIITGKSWLSQKLGLKAEYQQGEKVEANVMLQRSVCLQNSIDASCSVSSSIDRDQSYSSTSTDDSHVSLLLEADQAGRTRSNTSDSIQAVHPDSIQDTFAITQALISSSDAQGTPSTSLSGRTLSEEIDVEGEEGRSSSFPYMVPIRDDAQPKKATRDKSNYTSYTGYTSNESISSFFDDQDDQDDPPLQDTDQPQRPATPHSLS